MASTYTPAGIELIADGEQSTTWGDTTNTNWELMEEMVGGVVSISLSSTTYTLTTTDGATSNGRHAVIVFTGSPGGTCTVTVSPNDMQKVYFIVNNSNQTVTLSQGSGANVSVSASKTKVVYCDGAGSGAAVVDISGGFDSTTLAELGVTASAAELNIMDGVTATTAELNALDGFTGTVADLNYAKDLNATGVTAAEFDKLDGLTATTAELNILDGVTATAAEINKLDGYTGSAIELNYAKSLYDTGVTAVEFDKLDGLTATTAELNIMDGVTATTAEINKLDGYTGSATELNYAKSLYDTGVTSTEFDYLDGVTSAIQTQLNSLNTLKAPLASPTFTGTPAAPTATSGTNTTQVATTAFVTTAVTAATGSLGTMSSQNANNVAITGGSITGITDLAVAHGGTGASSITANSVVLGNGTSALSGNLVAPGTSGNVLTSNGSTWQSVALSSQTGFSNSKATNGYQKLPSGIILQWGTISVASRGSESSFGAISFPTSFTTTCWNVVVTLLTGESTTQTDAFACVRTISTSSFTPYLASYDSHTRQYGLTWIAIGY